MVVGSASNVYDPSVVHGGHSTSNTDPLTGWEGEMQMWKDPNLYDFEYLVTFTTPTVVGELSADYDAGATVRLKDGAGNELGSASCYDSNGGNINKCVVTSSSSSPMQSIRVVIDSHHSSWNWMGNYELYDGENNHITRYAPPTAGTFVQFIVSLRAWNFTYKPPK